MPRRIHYLSPPDTVPLWHVTITDKDGSELIANHTGKDLKEWPGDRH